MTRTIKDGIQDLSSSSRVNPRLQAEVGRFNAQIDSFRKRGMTINIKKITYPQLVFMDQQLKGKSPEEAAFTARPNTKHKQTARNWGMKQLENTFIQNTIKRSLESEESLSPDKIAKKVGEAFDSAVTVNDIVKVAEFVTKARGEMNDGNKLGVNIGVGIIGGQSTEELEKQFAVLVASGEDQPIESGENNLLDEITLGD